MKLVERYDPFKESLEKFTSGPLNLEFPIVVLLNSQTLLSIVEPETVFTGLLPVSKTPS